MAHAGQRGSILGYVLVGALLVALLVGGVLLVRNNISRLGGPATPQVATDNQQDEQKPADNGANQQSEADKQKAAEEKKAAEQKAADDIAAAEAAAQRAAAEKKAKEQAEAAQKQQQSGASPQTATETPHTSTAPSTTSDKLPQTGPMDDIALALAGAGLLIGATIAFMRSRAAL